MRHVAEYEIIVDPHANQRIKINERSSLTALSSDPSSYCGRVLSPDEIPFNPSRRPQGTVFLFFFFFEDHPCGTSTNESQNTRRKRKASLSRARRVRTRRYTIASLSGSPLVRLHAGGRSFSTCARPTPRVRFHCGS